MLKIDIKNNGEDLTESEAYYIRQHPYLVERSPTWVEKIEANAKGYNIILAPSEHNSTELIEQVQVTASTRIENYTTSNDSKNSRQRFLCCMRRSCQLNHSR